MAEWRIIPGYQGRYEVSTSGDVRRIWSSHKGTPIILPTYSKRGYRFVGLYDSGTGKTKRRPVHQIVAEAFLKKCPKGNEINHINGNKADNQSNNLEYVTHHENMTHCFRTGLRTASFAGECNPRAKLNADMVRCMRSLSGLMSVKLMAEQFAVSISTVKHIVSRYTWKHV